MASGVRIRRERPDHPGVVVLLDELDRYLASLYPPDANHILDVQALLAPGIDFRIAEDDGRILACGACRSMPGELDTQGRPYGEIKRMMTAPAARGRGLATLLIESLEAQLRAQDVPLALLETGGEQREAVRLYERLGYRRRKAFGGYPDNGLSVFYEKALA